MPLCFNMGNKRSTVYEVVAEAVKGLFSNWGCAIKTGIIEALRGIYCCDLDK